ncbi:hypothetical protein [Anaerosolibacter sp.]|uniref:hypothetical protein n=1 Tax=Anaerosolibacter sp. TaxID=1872527 RepID=UPI0039EFA502
MDLLKEMADALIVIIRIGVLMRVIFCFIKMASNEEEAGMHKKRAKHAVVFYILAESIWLIRDLVLGYYA